MRIVRNKSIPNVPDDRLVNDLSVLHDRYHTVEGLRVFDGPRRVLVDNGRKARLIVSELDRRGHGLVDRISCRACAGHLWKG